MSGDKKYFDYSDLKIWQEAMQLNLDLYELLKGFSEPEPYSVQKMIAETGLQLPCHIAYTQALKYNGKYIENLDKTKGVLARLESLLILARDLDLVQEEEEIATILDQTKKMKFMTSALIKKILKKDTKKTE